jgi:hypothetical protein
MRREFAAIFICKSGERSPVNVASSTTFISNDVHLFARSRAVRKLSIGSLSRSLSELSRSGLSRDASTDQSNL